MIDCMQCYDFSDVPMMFKRGSGMVEVEMGRQDREQVILYPTCLCGKLEHFHVVGKMI